MHGLTITEQTEGARSIVPASLAVIGLVATATAPVGAETTALDAAFPLNTPVLIAGNVAAAAGRAGTGGTLKPALEAIADQVSAHVIVVRVGLGEGENAAEKAADQDEKVIGEVADGEHTGLQALLVAQSKLGFSPRIIGCPGLDTEDVAEAMAIVAGQLRGFAYAACEGDDLADAITYRNKFSARELMLIWPGSTAAFGGDIVARTLGLRARIDEEQGWHKTVSNVALSGVSGISKDVHFDLLDPTTEAGALNSKQITTIIQQNGFRLWGNRGCANLTTEPEWSFESAVRTSAALKDEIAAIVAPFLDQPMTIGLIKDIIETGNARFRQLVNQGRIVGAEMFFDKDASSAQELSSGRPHFRIAFTPAAPLENPNIKLVLTDYYYTGFADQLL